MKNLRRALALISVLAALVAAIPFFGYAGAALSGDAGGLLWLALNPLTVLLVAAVIFFSVRAMTPAEKRTRRTLLDNSAFTLLYALYAVAYVLIWATSAQ